MLSTDTMRATFGMVFPHKLFGITAQNSWEPAFIPSAEFCHERYRHEPVGGLPFGILRIKHELGIPMIWVEHGMQIVADLADRLYVLDHGEPIVEGRPEEVRNDARVVEVYLGRRATESQTGGKP